jgi:imidazolonepropionase-like amidohydrolase
MLAIRAARAFDGERLIEGGIVAVEPASVSLPDAWPVADFSDSTVLPGLIDTHVHLCADSRDGALDRIAGYDDAARSGRSSRSGCADSLPPE